MRKLANFAAMVLLLGCPPALGFDFARYQTTDLDALMGARPRSGLDLYGPRPLKLRVTLVSYAEACETASLKISLDMTGVVMDHDAHPVTRCIMVRSKQGKDLRMFIQDVVSDFLPKEVPLGSPVTLFAIHVYTTTHGPGLLVNEFLTDASNDPNSRE
jgi:hypothetical protein